MCEPLSITGLFENQVKTTPHRIAVVCASGAALTYRAVNENADLSARYLIENSGIRPGDPVGIMVDRSERMVIGIMAILKAGGAYVPIDPKSPPERIKYILADSNCKALVTENKTIETAKKVTDKTILNLQNLNQTVNRHPLPALNGKSPAYILYTSGSTGKPKGVLMDHGPLVNLIQWMNTQCPMAEKDVVLLQNPFTFDMSVWGLFAWSFYGAATCLLAPGDETEPKHILNALQKHNVTVLHFVPSVLSVFLDYLDLLPHVPKVPALKNIFASGEVLSITLVETFNRVFRANGGTSLYNLYGPTETHVATYFNCSGPGSPGSVPIGKPIANTSIYILGKDSREVLPTGAVGEIYIGGACLARGYLNQPELTAENFGRGAAPLSTPLLYRTGDLGRLSADGNIEFLGRIDDQVKIRGFRVELGEIEYRLLKHPEIKEAVVTAQDGYGGDKFICAYLVAERSARGTGRVEKLREFLAQTLPGYMIPSYFLQLEKLPLTANGKVDKKALAQLQISNLTGQNEYIPPRNEREEQLTEIWSGVFNQRQIGISDNFFDLGGHSLKAAQVVSRVYKYFSVEIDLNDIFKEPTIAGLAGIIRQKKMTGFIPVPNVEEQEYYDVSNAQRRLWVLNQFENAHIAYNIPLGFSLKGELNTGALRSAFRHLSRRHESLRTSVTTINGLPRQVIHPAIDFDIPVEALKPGGPGLARTAALHAKTLFDLSEAPLFNVKLVKTDPDNFILLLNIHHIISDGWSMNILIDELSILYNAYADPGNLLPPLRTRYRDYTHWQIAYLSSPAGESQKNYWLEKLSGELPVLEFPTDYARPAAVTYNGKSIGYTLGNRLTSDINRLCKQQGVTLFMILLAAVKTLIYRYCGLEDIIVGSPAAARNHPDLEDQVGFFVNTLALRSRINENQPFEIFLQQVKQTTIEAFDNQAYPFDRLVGELNPDRDAGRHPLFDIMVVLQNNEPVQLKFDKIEAEPFEIQYNTAKFDLTFIFTESDDEIIMDIEYATDLFKAHRIRRLGTHFSQLLKSIVHDSKQTLPRLTLLTAREKHRLLVEFNDTTTGYPKEKTIAELFEDQAAGAGDRVAVIANSHPVGTRFIASEIGTMSITYRELNHRSNRFAYLLMEKGVEPDSIVAIMAERSPAMVVGILAILKAGGAYLPIDPDYPQERIDYMLTDSAVELLLTVRDEELGLTWTHPPPDGVPLSRGDLKDWEHPGKSPLERGARRAGCVESAPCPASTHPTHLSYVMYTSGSSGNPKGVMITQRSVVRLVKNTRYIQISGRDRILATGAPSFDASTFEIWGSLLNGAELHISNPGDMLNTAMLATLIQKETITIIWLTVGLFNTIADIDAGIFQNVTTLLVGGDRLSPPHIRKCKASCPSLNIINGYGPTENTTFTTTYEIPAKFKGDIPIGKPISNTRVTILDKHHQLLPIGVTGELYASGDGLARGYLNSVTLTAEKFSRGAAPHSGTAPLSIPLYRTGDLGRWRPDGNIEFLGRTDFQVKIRGYRIELGEIENQLAAHPQIQDAAVLSKENKNRDKYLCAFIVSIEQLNVTDLRDYLSKHLPYYMIPAYFSQLEELPLTPNGKIDKKALSKPEAGCHQMEIGSNYVPPRNETQKKLVNSWQEVLGVDAIGIHDNFFERGGDSIKAIQISSRLHQNGLKLEIGDVFNHPTIEKLAEHVGIIKKPPPQTAVTGKVEPTPIQKWFFENKFSNPNHFNQAVWLYRETGFDKDYIERSFAKIVRHHDALRMVYKISGNKVIQENRGTGDHRLFDMKVFDISRDPPGQQIQKEADRLQRGINLQAGPLVKLALFKTRHGDRLLIVIHHLVVDGVSWRILLEDFKTAYEQLEKGNSVTFRDKTDSFQYWAYKQRQYAKSRRLCGELKYWEHIFALARGVRRLPKDADAGERKYKACKQLSLAFSPHQTKQLLEQTNHAYNTRINDLLLTALALSLHKWSGLKFFFVNLEGHGREKIIHDVDINRTIGWFTSQFPVLLDISKDADREDHDELSHHIRYIKETLRKVPGKGIGFGILSYLSPFGRKLSRRKTPEICFNYLGEFGRESKPGIFEFSELNTKNNIGSEMEQPYALDISGIVINGKLTLDFRYNKNEYKKETVKKLAGYYKDALHEITRHCAAKRQKQLTPSDYGDNRLSLEDLDKITKIYREDPPIEKIYALSPMQEGFLFHRLLDSRSTAYFEQSTLYLEGKVDPVILQKSINILIRRHDILRSSFVHREIEKPRQVVLKERNIKVEFKDLSPRTKEEREREITAYKIADLGQGFDLTADPLLRFTLFKIKKTSWVLMWSFHHILMDGWCLGILFKELTRIYQSLIKHDVIPLEPAAHHYKSYIDWLEKQDSEEGLKYWENYLFGYEQPVVLPGRKQKKPANAGAYRLEEYDLVMDENAASLLDRIAAANQVTLSTLVQTAWALLLQRYNDTRDVVFGAVVSGRSPEIEGIEKMVGLFINTIPVRIKTSVGQSFDALIKEVQHRAVQSKSRDYLPLPDIQSKSLLKGDLINHIFVFENYPLGEEILNINSRDKTGFSVKRFEVREHTGYDFNLVVYPGKQLVLKFSFNSLAYDPETIKRTAAHVTEIINQVTNKKNIKVNHIDILTPDERHQLLTTFNDTTVAYPNEKSIADLFEDQAARTGDGIAVMCGTRAHHLTYKTLNEQAAQLAYLLVEKGAAPGTIVALMFERSIEMVTAIPAVLKAGGAFLPIDPDYPRKRIDYMLADSGAELLLTAHDVVGCVPRKPAPCHSSTNPNHLCYIIYTSGSTGLPKGVMIEHKSIFNYVNWANQYYFKNRECGNFGLYSPLTFDLTLTSIFCPLTTGNKIFVYPQGEAVDAILTHSFDSASPVDVIKLTPSHINLLEHLNTGPTNIKLVIAGGEALEEKHIDILKEISPSIEIVNEYGPTEATIGCITKRIEPGETPVLIGKPIANMGVFILDSEGRLQPVGVPGEIHLAGTGLARGYLNQPELTAEKFLNQEQASLFPTSFFTPLYRTGDLGRLSADGNIEFLGRIDDQVKIRGFRIELGEIQYRLLKHPAIKEAVVTAEKERRGDTFLCAYLVAKSGAQSPAPENELPEFLSQTLPLYMIPSRFVTIEKIPLTHSGKIDRDALSQLPDSTPGFQAENVPPRNQIEKKLLNIWKDVLGIEKIGITHNFFHLGGHSLKAIQIVSRVYKHFSVEISLSDIFKTPTIAALAEIVEQKEFTRFIRIEPVQEREYYDLSHAQRRLWVLNRFDEENINYNMPAAFILDGELNIPALNQSFLSLIERHESLRTGFLTVNGVPRQVIHKKIDFEVGVSTLPEPASGNREESCKQMAARHAGTIFHLDEVPLFKVDLLKISRGKNLFLFNMHHIISDGWSMTVFFKELAALYNAQNENFLPPLGIQYKDYAHWQNKHLSSGSMAKQREYWHKTLSGELPVLEFPTRQPRPVLKTSNGACIHFALDAGQTTGIFNLCREQGVTPFMVLLAAVSVLLCRYTRCDDIIIGSPAAGRNHPDLEDQLGCYINLLALRSRIKEDEPFEIFLRQLKQTTTRAYDNQIYPFDRLVDELNLERDTSRHPLFDVMVAMQNNEPASLKFNNIKVSPLEIQYNTSQFDLSFSFAESGDLILMDVVYNTDLFEADRIQPLCTHFSELTYSIIRGPRQAIQDLNILTPKEKKQLLTEFNNTNVPYPKEKTIVDLFEERVEKNPHGFAVGQACSALTYAELNHRSNQSAYLLIQKGVRADTIVAIFVERSLETIVGILAILKAGGAYLPIDPAYPRERIDYMMADSAADIIITVRDVALDLTPTHPPPNGVPLSRGDFPRCSQSFKSPLERGGPTGPGCVESAQCPSSTHPTHLCYIIYTSGSTGRPKGVAGRHSSVVNLVLALNRGIHSRYDKKLRAALMADYIYDASVQQLFTPLLNGHPLYIIDSESRVDTSRLRDFLLKNKIQLTGGTPALFSVMIQALENQTPKHFLKQLLIGGEALPAELVNRFYKNPQNKGVTITNIYGPTESTVDACYFNCTGPIDSSIVPIGKPLDNIEIYILNAGNRLQPVGAAGELCIGGAGLARGYLNNPQLTAEKFGRDTRPSIPHLYHTGDLARWLPDGNIEFLGRMDRQVKIRGFRIELGEIENRLLTHPDIDEAAVITKEINNQKELVACVVIKSPAPPDIPARLKIHLKQFLPRYMVPDRLAPLETMPLTSSGKIDKKSLHKLADAGLKLTVSPDYVPPGNQIEEKLVKIWQEVLAVEKIGIHDNFFDSGGHSLNAMQLVSEIFKEFRKECPLTVIFRTPSIRQIAVHLNNSPVSGTLKTDDTAVLYTNGGRKKIFFFPPALGYHIVFFKLAQMLTSYSVYAFNYIEKETRIDDYVNQITQLQPEGDYVLFGYSAGGNLAFEVAAQLKRKSKKVNSLILLDSAPRTEKIDRPLDITLYEKELNRLLNHFQLNSYIPDDHFKRRLLKKTQQFHSYYLQVINKDKINADIHLITSKDSDSRRMKWDRLTTGTFNLYQGAGEHIHMLDGGALQENAKILERILNRIP